MNYLTNYLYQILIFFAAVPMTTATLWAIDFEGGVNSAINFEPFVIEDSEGNPMPSDFVAELSLSEQEVVDSQGELDTQRHTFSQAGFTAESITKSGDFSPQTMSVGSYTQQINEAEKSMNEFGYSLRDQVPSSVSQTQKFDEIHLDEQVKSAEEAYPNQQDSDGSFPSYDDLREKLASKYEEVEENIDEYKRQYDELTIEDLYADAKRDKCQPDENGELGAEHVACFVGEMESAEPGSRPFLSANDDSASCTPDTPLGKAYLVNEIWSDSGGDSNFGWIADAKFKLKTDASGLSIEGSANAEGLFIGQSKKIVEAKANFTSPQKGKAKGGFSVRVFGHDIMDPVNKSWALHLVDSQDSDGQEKYLTHKEVSVLSTVIPMGFVPVTLSLDAKVTVGPQYQLDLMPVKIFGSAEWVNRYTLIASAGIGADLKLFVILAGVKGYIDLIDMTVGSYPEAGLALDEANRPKIFAKFNAKSKMKTLSGTLRLGVWAKSTFSVPQPKSSFPFVEMKPYKYEWSTKLGGYPGYDFPLAILFDKKIGYDICTGRKDVETLVANEPRQRDQRASFELSEKARIVGLENEAARLLDEALYGEAVSALQTDGQQILAKLAQVDMRRQSVNTDILNLD